MDSTKKTHIKFISLFYAYSLLHVSTLLGHPQGDSQVVHYIIAVERASARVCLCVCARACVCAHARTRTHAHTHTHTLKGTYRPAERLSSNRSSHHVSSLFLFLYIFVNVSILLSVWTTKRTSYNRTTIYRGDIVYDLRICLRMTKRAETCRSELA
jgi:hypothetical protein